MSQPASPSNKKNLLCKVFMLDDTEETFHVPHKSKGSVLFEMVVKKLQLLESDYFDLQYVNIEGMLCWLDHEKSITSHLPANSLTFEFVVKFYTPDPGMLEEEYTRYLFALQVKRDLLTGKMPCHDQTAALLLSYIVQADYGDLTEEDLELNPEYLRYISHFSHISEELENNIVLHHKEHFGQTPTEADFNLLDTARKVDFYGISLQSAKDHEGVPLHLAATHMGVVVFQCNTRINTFSWAKIRKLSFKRKKFLVKLHPEGYVEVGFYRDTVEFYFNSRNECKNFWKRCLEHHAFFRCHSVKKIPRNKTRVVSHGSSFRYSGRTQKQLVDFVRENFVKRPNFYRSTSMRTVSGISRTGTLKSKGGTVDTPGHVSRSRKSEILSPSQPPDKCRQSSTLGKIKKDRMEGSDPGGMSCLMSTSCGAALVCGESTWHERCFMESSFPLVEPHHLKGVETLQDGNSGNQMKNNDGDASYIQVQTVQSEHNLTSNPRTLHQQFSFDRTVTHPPTSQPPEQLPDSPSSPISQLATPKRYCSTELDALITRSAYLLGHNSQYDLTNDPPHHTTTNSPHHTNLPHSIQTFHDGVNNHDDVVIKPHLTTHSFSPTLSPNIGKHPSHPLSSFLNQSASIYPPLSQSASLHSPLNQSASIHSPLSQSASLFHHNNKIFSSHSDSVEDILLQEEPSKSVVYHIAMELLCAEITYMQCLRSAVQVFTAFVEECGKDGMGDRKDRSTKGGLAEGMLDGLGNRKNGGTKEGLAEGILRMLTPLLECHEDWVPTIKHRFLQWSCCNAEGMCLGDLFARNISMFRIYELYFAEYDKQMDDIIKYYLEFNPLPHNDNKALPLNHNHLIQANRPNNDKTVNNNNNDKTLDNNNDNIVDNNNDNFVDVGRKLKGVHHVTSLLLLPYHHLQHMSSAIKRLDDHCGDRPQDVEDRRESLKVIDAILETFKQKQASMENKGHICEMVDDIKGVRFLLHHQPDFVRKGCMQIWSKTACQQRLLLLFDNCLLVARRGTEVSGSFELSACLPTSHLQVVTPEEDGDHHLTLSIDAAPTHAMADHFLQQCLSSAHLSLGSLCPSEKSKWRDDLLKVISRKNPDSAGMKIFVEFSHKNAPTSPNSDEVTRHSSIHQSDTSICWHRSCSIGRDERALTLKHTHSGYVRRRFKGMPKWQSLWLVFRQCCLYFYKSYKDESPLTCLSLVGFKCCSDDEQLVFKLTYKNHAYFFKCYSEHAFNRWIQVLNSTIATTT